MGFLAKLGSDEGDSKGREEAAGPESLEEARVNLFELGVLAIGGQWLRETDAGRRDVPGGREASALHACLVLVLVGGHPHCGAVSRGGDETDN